MRLSVRTRAMLKRRALQVAELRRDEGDPAYSARDFLSELLESVLGPRDVAIIMARLQPVGLMNRVQALCPIERCRKLSIPGLLFCADHALEAATLDRKLSETEGMIRRCNFTGRNPDGSHGCSLYFRSLSSDLCTFHRPRPDPPPHREGATLYTLPLARAPKRSTNQRKKKKT